jgi:hypothetical protein
MTTSALLLLQLHHYNTRCLVPAGLEIGIWAAAESIDEGSPDLAFAWWLMSFRRGKCMSQSRHCALCH